MLRDPAGWPAGLLVGGLARPARATTPPGRSTRSTPGASSKGPGSSTSTATASSTSSRASTWYKGPDWTPYPVRKVSKTGTYRNCFSTMPMDVNGDGKMDFITCSYFERNVGWVENPGVAARSGRTTRSTSPATARPPCWSTSTATASPTSCPTRSTSSPGTRSRRARPSRPGRSTTSATAAAGHGVGSGDINGDGRIDLLTPKGWFEAPSDPKAAAPGPGTPTGTWATAGIQILAGTSTATARSTSSTGWATTAACSGPSRHGRRRQGDLDQAADRRDAGVGPRPELGRPRRRRPGRRTRQRQAGLRPRDRGRRRRRLADRFLHLRPGRRPVGQARRSSRASTPRNAPAEGGKRDAQKDFPSGTAGTGLEVPAVDMDGDGDLDLVCPGKSGLYWFENLTEVGPPLTPGPRVGTRQEAGLR